MKILEDKDKMFKNRQKLAIFMFIYMTVSEREKAKPLDETREKAKPLDETREELCEKYISILKSQEPQIINGASMGIWVKGKDRDSDVYKQVMKAYKYVHQDNKCSDFEKDGKSRKSKSRKSKNFK